MAASLDFSVDPSLPVSDNVPAVASERPEKTGFSRVLSFWDKISSQNEDDGSLQRTVPFNMTKNATYTFRKNQAHLSSLDDANKHRVNNDTCSTGEENRDEDNTSSMAMLPSIHDVAEGRDQLDIDEGNDSYKGTTNDTAFPAVQEKCNIVLQQPPHHHRDLPEEDSASVTSFPNNTRDPSNMNEGNVSLQGDVKHNNPILPSMHEESQRDFHIPFHYHRDPTEDGATKMILATDERDPSDMNEGSVSLQGATELIDKSLPTAQEESHVYFQLPFHYHRDPPEESATEIVAASNLGDPANILKENGFFQGASEPNEVSFETLQEEPDNSLQIPFHYHRTSRCLSQEKDRARLSLRRTVYRIELLPQWKLVSKGLFLSFLRRPLKTTKSRQAKEHRSIKILRKSCRTTARLTESQIPIFPNHRDKSVLPEKAW
jgi:hypothetical protein